MRYLRTIGIGALLLGTLGAGRAAAQDVAAEPEKKEWMAPLVVAHPLEGRAQCLMCHAGGIMEAPAVPSTHVDRPNDTCLWCHAPEADVQTTAPSAIPHALEGRDSCLTCHFSETVKEVPQLPANHAGRTEGFCTLCHSPSN
jgi:hypothetical protein